jgi:hypothetical protein
MKKLCILPLVAALAFFVSCQKQQSDEDRKAEVERQVQERLVAVRQEEEKALLAKQQADIALREKALAEKEAAAAAANVPAETAPAKAPVAETQPVEEPAMAEEEEDTSETRSSGAYGTFYRKLEPYGAWRETSDYGYVWQPREAEESRDWRPYIDGRWVYTDAGWTWVSDEPFGWATYHYGRWVRLRRVGWVWVPGQEWAPAWVSWRTSKDYVGWAPLPPEARFDRRSGIHNWADSYYDIGPDQYAFVPGNEFGSRRMKRSVVPVERNVTIVIGTTNITNITYSNTTVFNHGPNYDEIRSHSQQPIERYRLERQVSSDTAAAPTVRGEVLIMSAPAITKVKGDDRPQTVKETISQTTVEKSWAADTDRAAADRAREKMKAEVTPPANAPPKKFVKSSGSGMTATATAAPAAMPAVTPTTPALAPITRATPVVVASPGPASTVRPTPKPLLPTIAPPRPSPSLAVTPVKSVEPTAPKMTPTAPVPSLTLEHAPTPRRIVPTLMNTPVPRPSLAAPSEAVTKPTPRFIPGPRPASTPRPQVSPLVTPPVKSAPIDSSSRPPEKTKPAVPPTPPARTNPPSAPKALSSPRTESAPKPDDQDARKKGVRGTGQMEDTLPRPKPTPAEPR